MTNFIELTSPTDGRNFVVNTSHIISITPSLSISNAKSFILLSSSSVETMESVTEILTLIHKTENTKPTLTIEPTMATDDIYGFLQRPTTGTQPIKTPAEQMWLPIDSAPKDGSPVLVYIPAYSRPTWASYNNGVWTEDDDNLHGVTPTLWLPLPPLPKLESILPNHTERQQMIDLINSLFD